MKMQRLSIPDSFGGHVIGAAKLRRDEKLILAGDIGGTNARFDLYAVSNPVAAPIAKKLAGEHRFGKEYRNRDFPSVVEIIQLFIAESECCDKNKLPVMPAGSVDDIRPPWPSTAAIAVAGAVVNNRVNFTNMNCAPPPPPLPLSVAHSHQDTCSNKCGPTCVQVLIFKTLARCTPI